MKLPVVVTLLAVVTAAAASDCTVCFNGHCLATSSFYDGHTKLGTGRMVIDYANNIMYQYDSGIKAINLNTNTMTPVPMQGKGNYLAFNQDKGDLYYYMNSKDSSINIYKYQPKTNHTEVIVIPNPENKQGPLSLWIYSGLFFFNTHKESGYDVANGLNMLIGEETDRVIGFENLAPTNMVFQQNNNKLSITYIKSGNSIYRVDRNHLLTLIEGRYLMAGYKNSDVYLFDVTKRYIYKVDSETYELVKVGAYDASRDGRKRPNLKEFMFDGNNNLILKDRWSTLYYKATPAQCVFEFEENTGRTRITKL